MRTVDLRGTLPFDGNVFGLKTPKGSRTFHWNGGLVDFDINADGVVNDDDAIEQLTRDANLHIANGWGGISYHKAIGPTGTLYICRDPEAILAAVGNSIGNAESDMVQLMIGRADDGSFVQSPTAAMWATASELARTAPGGIDYGHRDWSATECPGSELYAWIQRKGWLEPMYPKITQQTPDGVLSIKQGEVAMLDASWQYEGGTYWKMPTKKFVGRETGRQIIQTWPPVSPVSDQTYEGGADPATWVIDVFPA